MLVKIDCLRIIDFLDRVEYEYKIIDTNFIKTVSFQGPPITQSNSKDESILIINNILQFIYDEIKFTSKCPFAYIKNNFEKFNYDICTMQQTDFYKKHIKVMGKLFPSTINNIITNVNSNTFSIVYNNLYSNLSWNAQGDQVMYWPGQ